MTGFYKYLCQYISKSWHIHFYPSQNVSPILLLNGLVMVTNEGSIVCKCFKKRNVNVRFNIAYFVHIWNIACHKKSLTFNLFFISKFKFDRVYGKILKYIQVSLLKPSFVKHWFIWCLLKHGTTWNKLQLSERTCNEQELTWNTLQRARNDLKQPTTSKYNLQRMRQSVLFSNMFSTQNLITIIRAFLHGESWWK